MQCNAQETLTHAHKAGGLVTLLSSDSSLNVGTLLEPRKHDTGDILSKDLEHKKLHLKPGTSYWKLKNKGTPVLFKEYARKMIVAEAVHLDDVNKMLRHPGDIEVNKF